MAIQHTYRLPLFRIAIILSMGLILAMSPVKAQTVQGLLESPSPNAFVESGVGLIRGWLCEAERVEVSIDNGPLLQAGYGTRRGDTEAVCGDRDNGFGLTFNWNNLGDGLHNLRVFVDGKEFANVNFTVVTLGGDFLTQLQGRYTLKDFPSQGQSPTISWSEPHQNFVFSRSLTIPEPLNPPSLPRALLESPTQGSSESGVGLIRGWVCEAHRVEISIDSGALLPTAYGTPRGDTEAVCGDRDNGFGLTFNWNNIGDGVHTLQAFADGAEFARVNFQVTTLGVDFLTGVDGQFVLADFPGDGQNTTLRWSEPYQNFTIAKTTATPSKLAAISAIQDLLNVFGVVGVGADSTETTGIRMAKDASGEPTRLEGITWADTATRQAADLELAADGAPTFYSDSSGVRADISDVTDTEATVTFHDTAGNPQTPVTLEIDGRPADALREIARRLESLDAQENNASTVSQRRAAPTTDAARARLSLSALRVNSYWYGSWASGEFLCLIQKAAVIAGLRDLVAPTACQSPLIRGFLERANALRSSTIVPETGVDPVAQQAFQFEADATDTGCNPDIDPIVCLTQPAQELQERNQSVEPPIFPEPELPRTYTLILNTTGTGTGSVDGGGSFAAGTTVTLTATPDTGSVFAGWSPSPCATRFVMPAENLTCNATFSLQEPTPLDITGQWTGSFYVNQFSDCKGTLEVRFTQTESQLTGFGTATINQSSPSYCGPGESESSDLSGTVEGNQILYGFASGATYTGTIAADGNSITGTAVDPDGYQATWQLTRR